MELAGGETDVEIAGLKSWKKPSISLIVKMINVKLRKVKLFPCCVDTDTVFAG